ncbi:hypothetical protein EII29_09745 [Leptotrichia sp. OH3620_COT-345]|uniref:hypothetical protein n=1 Tax=Leptotrichia sp. OH3620_COT-345 TaxID=2491048 RepID=UPI000F649CF3|nr:hypothetical protein [Leptotrichia sp. OH3620_COT-345]RRD38798.1 hypothetical protein EII29_09745 [Leptotrichia sp. OH3620_COT-345]
MFNEKKIYCPCCGAVLAIEKEGKFEKVIHIKGSKTEVFIGSNTTYVRCNSRRKDSAHKEICGTEVILKNGKE